jgi:hypothetical protein
MKKSLLIAYFCASYQLLTMDLENQQRVPVVTKQPSRTCKQNTIVCLAVGYHYKDVIMCCNDPYRDLDASIDRNLAKARNCYVTAARLCYPIWPSDFSDDHNS